MNPALRDAREKRPIFPPRVAQTVKQMMAKRSEPALSKPEARTGLRGRATDEVKVRGFHQGHGRQLSSSKRPDICEQTRFSIIKKDDGLAPRLGPYIRALNWRLGAWRPRSATVCMHSGEHGLPRLSFCRFGTHQTRYKGIRTVGPVVFSQAPTRSGIAGATPKAGRERPEPRAVHDIERQKRTDSSHLLCSSNESR
jgi:hypothetical protein